MSDHGARPGSRRYALVGTGYRGRMYLDALLGSHADIGRPVALCDRNSTRMRYYNDLWSQARPDEPALPMYPDSEFSALLRQERPDAVIVTSVDSTHHRYIVAALDHGCDVIVEKPLTTDADRCGQIVRAALRSHADLVVAFNYRYSPRNAKVKELLADGAIGAVTSVHFEWVLDTVHGADYYRRWHREKASSGGLLVHKSSHHFDLVNWWLAAVPDTVFAFGDLRFYGRQNAEARGLHPADDRSRAAAGGDPFALDLSADAHLRRLYLDAEHEDGYRRDRNVFGDGITIEDNMAVVVRYANRALLTYSLNAHAPWEGYRVGLNGTEGRIDLEVCERAGVRAGSATRLVVGSADADEAGTDLPAPDSAASAGPAPARREGTRLILQRHWEPAQLVEVVDGPGAHGGGDALLLDDLFRGDRADPLAQRAGFLDGARSMLVGAAANRCIAAGEPVRLADFGIPLDTVARAAAQRSTRLDLDPATARPRSG